MEKPRITHKQFISFIDREAPKAPGNVVEYAAITSIHKMGEGAIKDFRNLIALAKTASREQDSAIADLFYELKELKEKEIGIIHNYLRNH